ncbi:MAG: glycosyltransferase [Hyphomicrobiales bacterium]
MSNPSMSAADWMTDATSAGTVLARRTAGTERHVPASAMDRSGTTSTAGHRLVMIHPIDPRGNKVGGIETHVRVMLQRHPADFSVLLIGVDGRGDLEIGKPVKVDIGGRTIDFLPIVHVPDDEVHQAATSIGSSITFRVATALLRHYFTIRRLIGKGPATIELQRFEFAPFARALGLPTVQIVHGEGSKDQKMDSLIKRFWFIHATAERIALRLADRIVGVNPNIVKRIEADFPAHAEKSSFMTVSVDTDVFPPQPFDIADDVFRVVFTGRLDAFKDPPTMFRVMERLGKALDGRLEFHYVGTSDPHRYPEFAAIEHLTVRHGFKDARGVHEVLSRCHAGILTSYFEGMPCFLLETMSTGRPMGAIRLPQYDPLVETGKTGFLMERLEDGEATVEEMAAAWVRLWQGIKDGTIRTDAVHARVEPYSVATQLPRLFDIHRSLVATPAR